MARNDAVGAVTGQIFREGWSKVRGSMQGLGQKRPQMVRAAKGHRSAVFKPIRSGGCQTKKELSNQLEYLTTKSSHIVDSRGVLDGKRQLSADEIKSVVDRFSGRWDEGFRPKMGHTTHMLMSYPVGTKGEDVRDISAGVCERFFANEERNFDYIIAIHEDRDHPHAHIVINRRSQEGEYFYLGRDHHFNYDDFRTAMVEEAEKVGVRLEATKRVERGDTTYAPRTKEIYDAKNEDREPVPRERVGHDLDHALAEIAATSKVYRSLAAEASAENREDISNALFRAGEILANGGQLEQNGEVYMANQESFDDLRGRFAERAERVEQFVRDAPDGMKARYEKQLDQIYRNVAHMQPMGVRSQTLNDAPSDTGIYSETNINKDGVGATKELVTRAQIETALRGTGISSSAVIARVEQGASNASLEQRWIADDLSKIAKEDGLNLERQEDLAIAAEKLDQVHVKLGETLERAEVLRDDGVIDNDPTFAENYFKEVERPEQQEYLSKHPEILSSPSDVFRMNNDTQEYEITDQPRADQIDREINAVMDRSEPGASIEDAVAADFKARYPDMPDHLAQGLGQTYGTSFELNNVEAEREAVMQRAAEEDHRDEVSEQLRTEAGAARAETDGIQRVQDETVAEIDNAIRPYKAEQTNNVEIGRVIEHERNDKINSPFPDDRSREIYRGEIERELSDERLDDLRDGNSEALSEVIDDRLDRLYAAKAYLQSDEATANSEATREVVSDIAEEEYDTQRLKRVHTNADKGQTHG